MGSVPVRRIYSLQMLDKEIPSLTFSEFSTHCMARTSNQDKFEVLASLFQGMYDLTGRSRIDIVIDFPQDQHQFPLQFTGIDNVGTLFI